VIRPREIDGIRDAADRRTITELRQHATSLEEFVKLADSYAIENDQLRAERTDLRLQLESLETEVSKLEGVRQALTAHLRAANAPAEEDESPLRDGIELGADGEAAAAGAPARDEVRFYKKVYARPTHDVMVRVQDCGCNNWETAHAADKARKGISKLENRNEWKTMQHCASCTGGGMWKVRW
jgi:chromosome segregation ATPase